MVLGGDVCRCLENTIPQSTGAEQDTPTKKCFGKFGCYSLENPWSSQSRPVSLFPEPPEKINPEYCLYTRRNPTVCDQLYLDDPQTLFRSNYVPSGQVYFISHGFVENGHRPWIMDMVRELLKRSNANVIAIDWSGGSQPPYAQAVANIRLVGVMTAHLIQMMSEQVVGLQTERIHIIGHSLGAHLASYVGTTLRRTFNLRLGRITGLDPAEPHFSKTDALVRLDPTDAIFVDNIHTDANSFVMGGLGMKDPAGHVDFYPNGGRDQPGCEPGLMKYMTERGSFFKGLTKMIGCNHVRSYQYFIETINSPEKFLAVECKSWEHYLNGTCFKCDYNPTHKNGTQCAKLGFHSMASFFSHKLSTSKHRKHSDFMLTESPKRRFVNMYVITGAESPFYRSQYRVSWKISDSCHEIGKFKLQIIGSDGSTTFMSLGNRVQYFDPGSEHRVVVAGARVGHLESAVLQWYQERTLNPLTWRIHETSVSISSIRIDSLETGESLTLCQPENTILSAGSPKKLNLCSMN
ncbi:hypothetical protein RUM43_008098 [Polyplax serrata]|uniref:Lipase domain-containing protein n=1 Tax=Polyplax serrata TaxID=468196 RepID=A0AAN8Q6S6_POLSC